MSKILRKVPFFDRTTTLTVQGQSVRVYPLQIIVWISISEKGLLSHAPDTLKFPAVLDTGCNHNLVIQDEHLMRWAGIHSQYLPRRRGTRVYGEVVPQLAANVWLHPNVSRSRDELTNSGAFPLHLFPGIAVIPKHMGLRPRLPLLGMRALRAGKVQLRIDYRRCLATLRSSPTWWPLA